MSKKLKLGDTQQDVLAALNNHNGWHAGCGWIWGNRSSTIKILESLRKHGVVDKNDKEHYFVSDYGKQHLKNLRPYLFK